MGGGIAQLASYGLADVYLTGNPQITFWKLVYRRHTLFAMESIQQTFDGTADFGRKATVTISRNGDLVGPVWLEVTLPDLLTYDITPTPADGNAVDVTAAAAGLAAGGVGYWQTKVGNVCTVPVAFGSGAKYYAAATINGNAVTQFNAGTSVYSTSQGDTAANVSVTSASELVTWPYLCRAGGSVPYTYSTPSHALRWTNSIGHAIISSVEIEIGGTRIDKHYGEWLDVWSELTEKEEKRPGFWEMIGKYTDAEYDAGYRREQSKARTLYVPLKFCFNTAPGLYLPLVALSYHQIKYNFEFRPYLECVKAAVPISQLTAKNGGQVLALTGCNLFADYVFLDAPERIRMAEIPHEYLCTQLQFLGDEAVPAPSDPNGTRNRKYRLNFNHPVRELVWVYVAKSNYEVNSQSGNNWFKYGVPGDDAAEIFDEARLVINGHDRFSARSAPYFRLIQPYEHHTRCPGKKVHCYSFSLLSPEDYQPSGQANFSRFDAAELQFTLNANLPVGRLKIFAYAFNVLRVASGLAGLAFSG
jgi:hypothetical protein